MNGASLLLALALASSEEGAARTTAEGVYSAKQAERGKESYKLACAGCHALEWYRGDAMKPWAGATLASLYDVIATTMPQNNPGSLKRREYVDLLAYILSLNDMPAGAEDLPAEPENLKKITVKWRSKP